MPRVITIDLILHGENKGKGTDESPMRTVNIVYSTNGEPIMSFDPLISDVNKIPTVYYDAFHNLIKDNLRDKS